VLQCNNIRCQRGEHVILDKLCLKLEPGNALVLRGDNGSGKTSLLRMLAGLRRPAVGKITWCDLDIFEHYDRYREDLHFVGHKNPLQPDMTVKEYMQFWSRLSDVEETLEPTIFWLKLGPVLDLPLSMLSAGWTRRVILSRLMLDPVPLWFLDEPFTNLDGDMTDMILKLIASRCDQGGAVVLSCHRGVDVPFGDELDVMQFAPDRVQKSQDNKQDGKTEDVTGKVQDADVRGENV